MWCQGELCGVRGSYVVSGGVRWGQKELCGHLDMGRLMAVLAVMEMALMQVQVAHQGGGVLARDSRVIGHLKPWAGGGRW